MRRGSLLGLKGLEKETPPRHYIFIESVTMAGVS